MEVSRSVLISKVRALNSTLTSPRPPSFLGLCRTSSSGFSSWSANSQDLTLAVIFVRSQTRRFTELHLNHTLARQKLLREEGLLVKGMNFPPLHAPVMFRTLLCSSSQLSFLVFWKLAMSLTPSMSKCSDKTMYFTGRSSLVRVPFHLPSGRNLTFPEAGSLCSLHPEAASNREEPWSMVICHI